MTAGLPPQGARATIVVILVNSSVAVQPRPAASPWSPLLRARHRREAAVASCPAVTTVALELARRRR
ncbi:uncharacterized protein DS421_15g503720 [Arachis hypogaea]|nr:uncharacterized protein DS421_15g503720 [Arachis hypogaea]